MKDLSVGELFGVEGKTVLVTGGARGIGLMIAAGFVANGARVYIASRSKDACEACLLYTSPSPRDQRGSRMPSSA